MVLLDSTFQHTQSGGLRVGSTLTTALGITSKVGVFWIVRDQVRSITCDVSSCLNNTGFLRSLLLTEASA